ncbi:secreted phosphoprotein 24 [Rhinophrynus dorsalis]
MSKIDRKPDWSMVQTSKKEPRSPGLPISKDNEDILGVAVNASLARVNSQSWGSNLFRVTNRFIKNLLMPSPMDFDIIIEFRVRETICNKNSARDPESCDFKMGHYMEATCTSEVQYTEGQVRAVSTYCHPLASSSSESYSSEEIWRVRNRDSGIFRKISERFPSQWDPYGKRNQDPNPRWDEELWDIPGLE